MALRAQISFKTARGPKNLPTPDLEKNDDKEICVKGESN